MRRNGKKKKPLRINDEILRDLREALGKVYALLPDDAQKRYPSIAVYAREQCAVDEKHKRGVEPYVASWILAPLDRAVRRIESARVVQITTTITEPDCTCSTSHDPPDGAIHGGSVMVEDDYDKGPDAWPGGDWCDSLSADVLEEARAHARQRAEHYQIRGYEIRRVEIRR